MTSQPPPFRQRSFSLRWRGRRWYDPNEVKLLWSAICAFFLGTFLRISVLALAALRPAPLQAKVVPPAGILGTAHDLSASGLHHITESQEVCIFCHTPHKSPEGISQTIPVWNHVTTTVQFSMYNGGVKGSIDSQPAGPSLACLSCHDGTVAMGAMHEVPQGGGQADYSHADGGVSPSTGLMQGDSLMGRDLSSVHPISMAYRDDLSNTLRPPSELVGVKLYPANVRGAKVQCASCHDPHNFGSDGSTAPFLRVTKRGSALCLACHRV